MKNWKYIEGAKTGNTAHSDKVEVIKRLLHANWSVQEIYELLKKEGYEVDKNFIERMKTGNDTPWEYAHRKPKVINDDKTGAEEFFKQLSDDVKEREKKDDADIEKVGNTNLETSVEKGKLGLWNWYVHKDGTIVSGGTSSTEANAKEMARKALEKEKAGNKVGNFKTGNATPNYRYKDFLITNPEGHEYIVFLKDGRTVGYRGTTSKAQAEDWCDWHDPKTGKSIGNKKLKFTDKKDGLKEFVYDEENDKGYIYYDGKLVDTIPHAGQGWLNLIKQKAFSSGVMNKTGNAKDKNGKDLRVGDIVLVWTSAGERAGKVKAVSGDRITVAIRNEGDWSTPGKLADKVSNSKTGNESPDDKFAYVMREFDEGKLKTPDGKVVTDPAQAKAIAYSESKKTENGLARARKAMNAWNSERKIEPVGKYREFIRDLKNAIMLDVAAVTYNNVDEQTLKSWVEQAKKEGFGSAIKGVQGKKVILDVY